MLVVLDTSFVLTLPRVKPNPLEQILRYAIVSGFLIPEPVLKELRSLSLSRKRSSAAKLALAILEGIPEVQILRVESVKDVDEYLLSVCSRERWALATVDKRLIKSAKALGITTISLSKGRVVFGCGGKT